MMARAAHSSGDHAQNQADSEDQDVGSSIYDPQPLYSSETPLYGQNATFRLSESDIEFRETRIDTQELADGSVSLRPTPAIMARKQSQPSTFASLDTYELPVVREYSAGGLIFDDQDRVAIIARHSRSGHLEWCLPKGHIEKGETPEQTAVREVHEETGILGEIITSIATIDYWFTGTTQRVHKLVHHYALRMIGGELTVEGDPDHEAEDAIWVRFDDLNDVLSYPNERRIAWLYARKHKR
ncbi:MutT/NUDIX family protein [Bifidobacterium margollesii]|uniref:MutT/NUDIX family protein n=2 Tax=Bifidobacterium margollesii TaxID=2020964 RepID=A0A2N5J9Y0_9BIFI|nr:MutT/NUDIX family protein [Bifidobacterium margollesii]